MGPQWTVRVYEATEWFVDEFTGNVILEERWFFNEQDCLDWVDGEGYTLADIFDIQIEDPEGHVTDV